MISFLQVLSVKFRYKIWKYCALPTSQKAHCISVTYTSLRFISFSNLLHFYFPFLHLQFFSTCFGPAGPSSGESNVLLHRQPLAPFPRSLMCRSIKVSGNNTRSKNTTSKAVKSLTPTATNDTSTTEGTVPEAVCVIKHLILLMMDRSVRNMWRKIVNVKRKKYKCIKLEKK